MSVLLSQMLKASGQNRSTVSDGNKFVRIDISREIVAREFSAGASETDALKSADTFL